MKMDSIADQVTDELSPGHELSGGSYRIVGTDGATPSGFKYDAVARDGAPVAIREFYLRDLCHREDLKLVFNANADRTLFRKLVRGFVTDARYLESLESAHVATVADVFEENETAYMVTVPPEGRSLESILEDGEKDFKPVEVARIANHLFSALVEIHAFGMLHRDVSPKNIVIASNGDAVLLPDFGTFREDETKMSKVVSSVLRAKSAHAPLEFIFDGSDQNEASDVYSVASVIYMLITGAPPVPCQDRLSKVAASEPDPYVPLENGHPKFDDLFLKVVDMALRLLNEDRIRSATEFLTYSSRTSDAMNLVRMRSDAYSRRPKRRGLFSFLPKLRFWSTLRPPRDARR